MEIVDQRHSAVTKGVTFPAWLAHRRRSGAEPGEFELRCDMVVRKRTRDQRIIPKEGIFLKNQGM